jgi:hypothetical protein
MQGSAIVALCIGAAVAYGIVHDQITARICVEYFTIGHPPVFATDSPTLLAVGWGVIATWWAGAIQGVGLALAARAGNRPRRDVRSLVRPVATLLLAMAVCAALAGSIGYLLGRAGMVFLVEPLARLIPPDQHARFLADLWAHSASYLVGFLGGAIVMARVWRGRRAEAGSGTK